MHPIEQWMRRKKINTQGEAAGVLNLSQGYLSDVLSFKHVPSPDTALRLSTITGISINKLLFPRGMKANAKRGGRV